MSAIKSLSLVLLLAACTSPVKPQDSGVPTPDFWQQLVGQTDETAALTSDKNAAVEQHWWKHFNDPVLDQLVATALQQNKTIAIAKARVDEARALRTSTRSILFPQINGVGESTRQNPGGLFGDTPYSVSQAQLETRWELDLFGKNQARSAQATALLESEIAYAQGVRVSLLAEIARNYFDLRNAAQQIRITTDNIAKQQQTLDVTNAQLEGAFASGFDVERAASQLAITQAQLPVWKTAHAEALNRLHVLLGQTPGSLNALLNDASPQPPLPATVVLAAPATVLATRPDIRAAERQLAASIAGADAATRELFPTIGLLAFFGTQDFNGAWASPWGLSASLTQPILNFGRIQGNIDAADARQQQAFLQYQQTVLEALADMENALARYLNETNRNAALTQASLRSGKASELSNQQYKEGESGLLDLLIVERDALAAESAKATSDTALRQALVAVYSAAGGGWHEEAAVTESASTPSQND